jgi:ribosomal protein S18 acetylase RimI-like enzyme
MTAFPENLTILPIAASDYQDWLTLWNANNGLILPENVTEDTWQKLLAAHSGVNGFMARVDGVAAGLVHFVLHPVTGSIEPAAYMQDLYVSDDFRRQGIGNALVVTLALYGREQQWVRIYWLAEGKNESAQALYKKIGIKLDFTFHVLPCKMDDLKL